MNKTCHDCGVKEGQIHKLGCDMERCPFCGGQLISCDCSYKKLGIDPTKEPVYSKGLSEKQETQWLHLLNEKGRIPYVRIPYLCAKCGKLYPDMFNVPNEEWEKYIIPELQSTVLCAECYEYMKKLFPDGWRKKKYEG